MAFFFEYGHLPNGDHYQSCDNRACCNPKHLDMQDANLEGLSTRHPATSTVCVRPASFGVGEQNGNAMLSEADVVEIIRLVALGKERRRIAERFGISIRQIQHIVSGTRWSHIER